MFKCLFCGHDWKLERTYEGKRYASLWCGRCSSTHDLTLEYYKCSRCGMWKRKTFIDPNYFEIAKKRIENEPTQLTLPEQKD